MPVLRWSEWGLLEIRTPWWSSPPFQSGCRAALFGFLWEKGFLPGQSLQGRQSRIWSDVILRVFFNPLWDMARTSKAKEEMRIEIEMSLMAILMDMRFWKIEFGTIILLTLSPMDWRKFPMTNKYHLLSRDLSFTSDLARNCVGNTMRIRIQEFIYVERGL